MQLTALDKGKVESGIKYVKRFLRGKSFESLEHLNNLFMSWLSSVADQRIHGTTHRKPIEMFEEEKTLLIDHRGKPPYMFQERVVRHVAKNCLVTFETNRYSVPFRFVGKEVEVQSEMDQIRIYYDGHLIGIHPRLQGSYEMQVDQAHYQGIFNKRESEACHRVLQEEVEVRYLSFYENLVEGSTL